MLHFLHHFPRSGFARTSLVLRSASTKASTPLAAAHLLYDKQYINGKWVPSSNKDSFIDVTDSNTGEIFATVADGTAVDTEQAIIAASNAFHSWSNLSLLERKRYIQQILEEYEKVKPDIANALTKELGAPQEFAKNVHSELYPFYSRQYLSIVDEYEWVEELDDIALVVKEPIGVVGAITPWNWPLNQIACKMVPALLAGCTFVLKPSEVTPINAYLLTEAVHASGLPPGVFNMVCGTGPKVGEVLATHPLVDMVSFTGSTGVGKHLHMLGSSTVKRVRSELGGRSAIVVLPDATAEQIEMMATQILENSGQSCLGLGRMIAPGSRYEEIVQIARDAFEKVQVVEASNEAAKTGDIGPVASRTQYDKIRSYIQKGIEEGARLVTGGLEAPPNTPTSGYFIKPTIFADAHNDMTVVREEIFGPVLCIIPYESEEEAIDIANDTIYGLSNAVIGADQEHAMKIASRLRSGQVHVNTLSRGPTSPFGGYKQSGDGREVGTYGLEEFLQIKSIHRPKPAVK